MHWPQASFEFGVVPFQHAGRKRPEKWSKPMFFRWISQDASYITRMNMFQTIVLAAVLMVSWGTLKDSVMFGWFWVGWWCWWCWWCSWRVGDVLMMLMHFPNEKIDATVSYIRIPQTPGGNGFASFFQHRWRPNIALENFGGVDDMIGPWSSDFRFPD